MTDEFLVGALNETIALWAPRNAVVSLNISQLEQCIEQVVVELPCIVGAYRLWEAMLTCHLGTE